MISTAGSWLFQAKNGPRKLNKINGRISPIRPFQKV
jgi:hypothetical protein